MSNSLIAIDVKINASDATSKIEKLKKALKDKMLMEAVGAQIASFSRERIASRNNTAPDGSQWPSLAADTIRAKQKKGKGNMGILMQKPSLLNSIAINPATLKEDSVSLGSTLLYAMIHQKGGKAGRGRKVTIPARPYIGVSAEGKRKLEIWKLRRSPKTLVCSMFK